MLASRHGPTGRTRARRRGRASRGRRARRAWCRTTRSRTAMRQWTWGVTRRGSGWTTFRWWLKEAARGSANWTGDHSRESFRAELAQKVRGAFFLAPLVRAWRAGDARVRRAMPPLSGKDAILAAARRLAERGDDALDEDLLDAELALADPARDEEQAFAEAPGDGERPLRPEDLGLPPARRVAREAQGPRHAARVRGRPRAPRGGSSRRRRPRRARARGGAARLGVGGWRSPAIRAARGTRRASRLRRRRRRLGRSSTSRPQSSRGARLPQLEARSAEAWRRGERAEGVDPRTIDNAAVSPTIKNLIAARSRREREADLPKGAGPAGRHEPTTRVDERTTVPSVMGVSLFANESREAEDPSRRVAKSRRRTRSGARAPRRRRRRARGDERAARSSAGWGTATSSRRARA